MTSNKNKPSSLVEALDFIQNLMDQREHYSSSGLPQALLDYLDKNYPQCDIIKACHIVLQSDSFHPCVFTILQRYYPEVRLPEEQKGDISCMTAMWIKFLDYKIN